MQDCSFPPKSDPFERPPILRTTFGQLLTDGSIIELVMVDDTLKLCHSDGTHHRVLPSIELDNIIYTPPRLEPSLYAALTFPGPPAESGSTTRLFEDTVAVFQQRGFSREVSHWGGLFSRASWLPEFFLNPPVLIVYGADMQQAATFLALLSCTSRRPFFSAQLSRSLPFQVQPTLLILAAEMSASKCAFWRATNIAPVRVPTRGGAVESLATAKALFAQDSEALTWWGPEAWRVPLLPSAQRWALDQRELALISKELQPRMLAFRLQRLTQPTRRKPPHAQKQFSHSGISRQVLKLVEGEPDIINKVTPLLEDQEREFLECQRRDPYGAIVECLWSPSHSTKDMAIKDLTVRLNILLAARGETLTLEEHEVGWRLKHLDLPRRRNGKGMLVRFSADVSRQLHQLVRNFNLNLPKFKDCTECSNWLPAV